MSANKFITNFLFFISFLVVTLLSYLTDSYIDYSNEGFTLIRILVMGVGLFYFSKLSGHISILQSVKEKLNKYSSAKGRAGAVLPFLLMVIHLVVVAFLTEKINNRLLDNYHLVTTAIIKDCSKSKGAEHCLYSYMVDNSYYEIKYDNEIDNYRFKNNDTVKIIYFPFNPVISRFK